MQNQLLRDIMTPAPETIRPDEPLVDAARLMRDFDTGILPVVSEDENIEGVITDRDIAVRAVAEGLDIEDTAVSEVMTPEYHSLFEDQTVDEALELMQAQQVRRILVLDRQEKIAGIISLGDVSVRTSMDQESEDTLEEISVPKKQKSQDRDRSQRM
jgi:CBS domain-containing protein